MKRRPKPWTEQELALLGTRSDGEIAALTDRTFGTVWQKRRALGIPQPPLQCRRWTPVEDKLVGTASDAAIAARLNRTLSAVKTRRANLEREQARRYTKPVLSDPRPCSAALAALGAKPVAIPRDPSLADDDRYRLLDGPYFPPRTARGRFLVCELRGTVKIGGYSDAPIPWPRIWRHRSLVICGDLLRALKTESVYAVSYHWGLSRATVSYYRQQLSIPRQNPGSYRLFREIVIEAARTPEALAKQSAAREGKPSTESARDRERLRRIQRRPKSMAIRRRMAERMRRRFDLVGPYPRWTPQELALIATMPDREVARRINRSLSAVRSKKFALRKNAK
jgi:hypothetical protein